MIPCPECKRHLRESEVECPFCGAGLLSSKVSANSALLSLGAFAFSTLALLGTTACSKDGTASDGQTTTTQGTTVEDTSESGMSETETDTDDSSEDTSVTSGSFYAGSDDDIWGVSECDPFFQDCPEGEKCVAYASGGQTWDANKCVPVTGDGQPGEPCLSNGIIESADDCDETSYCFYVQEVEGQLQGVCTAFCEGNADEPECPPDHSCVISNDGTLNLCLLQCDPLGQDCPAELACFWLDDEFGCTWPSQNPIGQSCEHSADCAAGSMCVDAEFTPDCGGAGCCVEYCSLSEPSCSQPETECVAFYEDPPLGYEDVGLCLLPG